jgi:hypothetical protein
MLDVPAQGGVIRLRTEAPEQVSLLTEVLHDS